MRIDEGLGGTPADVSIRVFGTDLDELARLGAEVRERVEGIDGLTDLRVEELTGLPQVRVAVDRAAAARVGLTPGDVVQALRVGLVGETVSEVRIGQRRYDLVVRLPDERRGDVGALRVLLVDGHDGTRIPLGKLASIEQTVGPGTIKREAGSRRIAVEGSVVGRDLGTVADEVEARLADLVLPTGSFLDVGGRIESQERASAALFSAVVVAVAGVFVPNGHRGRAPAGRSPRHRPPPPPVPNVAFPTLSRPLPGPFPALSRSFPDAFPKICSAFPASCFTFPKICSAFPGVVSLSRPARAPIRHPGDAAMADGRRLRHGNGRRHGREDGRDQGPATPEWMPTSRLTVDEEGRGVPT
jgi:hypothetical protein